MSSTHVTTLLIDTNVWLAYFIEEERDHRETSSLMAEAARQGVTLAYTPTTLKDVFYIIPRRLRRIYAADDGDKDIGACLHNACPSAQDLRNQKHRVIKA